MNTTFFMRILLILLSICLFSNVDAKENEYNLLGLGDSITSGFGVSYDNSYLSRVGEYLNDKFTEQMVNTINYALDGLKSGELLNMLKKDNNIKNEIEKSHLIVISIGGNDFLNILPYIFSSNFKSMLKETGDNLLANMNEIYEEIFNLNAYVNLIVIPLYNPYLNILQHYPEYLNEFDNIKLEYLKQIKNSSFKVFSLEDIQNKLEKNEYLIGGTDPHPNVKGHELLAKEVIEIVDNIYQETKDFENDKKDKNILLIVMIIVIVVFILKMIYTIFRK